MNVSLHLNLFHALIGSQQEGTISLVSDCETPINQGDNVVPPCIN